VNLRLLKRRAEMLDAVCTGLHPSAVISQLAEKYEVSEKALWSDWLRRQKWVPFLLELEKFADFSGMVVERLNGVQKAAWSIYLKASNDSARVGALRTVLEALEIYRDIVQTQDVLDRLERLEEATKERDKRFSRGGRSLH
jgi:hypothetical protein